MNYQVVLLFIVAILNAVFSFFTLRGKKDITNILFSLFTLALALWALNIAFFINTSNLSSALIFANLYYIMASAIPLLFFYFSMYFLEYKKPTRIHFLYLVPFLLLLLSFTIDKNVLLKSIYVGQIDKEVVFNNINYLFYIIYFIFYVVISYYNLLKSFFSTKELIKKIQLKFIIVGTIFAYILGMIFNLFLPAIGNYHNIWLGPLFTLIMVFSMEYAILKHHLFGTKVVVAEMLTFMILVFILIDILITNLLIIKIINIVVLFVVAGFSLLLIGGVRKEVIARERVEKLAGQISMANEKLRQLEKQKTEFVSIASHQLRTPLTAIKGYASMLLEGSFGELSKKVSIAVEKIFKSSQTLVIIIEDFLMMSRIEQGCMKYQFGVVKVDELLKEIISEVKPIAQEKRLDMQISIEVKNNFDIYADRTKIKQVIYNIIDNSIKYTNEGFIKILLSKNIKNNAIKIVVSDTGIGISKKAELKLFDKFTKGKDSMLGSGIGLYIAKEIVKAHKGHIWVQSEGEGYGTTFFVELPILDKIKDIKN